MNQPWPKIVARYTEYKGNSESVLALRELTRKIERCHLAQSLFGWTSMFDLCITQTAVVYPYDGPYLKISPLEGGQVEFRYLDTGDMRKQWSRTEVSERVEQRFLKFLEQLHWVTVPSFTT